MTIKAVCFDFDGVLVPLVDVHARAFLKALQEVARISMTYEYHTEHLNGLSTRAKLARLREKSDFDADAVWERKQAITDETIPEVVKPEFQQMSMLSRLRSLGYKVACVSNSIRRTTLSGLRAAQVEKQFDVILSNEDVHIQKPDPTPYYTAFGLLGVEPSEALIIEDAPQGVLAATRSGGYVLRVDSYKEVVFDRVMDAIQEANAGTVG